MFLGAWLLLLWEGLLSDKVRGREEEQGGALYWLRVVAAWWGQQQSVLQHLADQLIVRHADADQRAEELLGARDVHHCRNKLHIKISLD